MRRPILRLDLVEPLLARVFGHLPNNVRQSLIQGHAPDIRDLT